MDLRTWLHAHWDRALAVALVALGGLALLLGWLGVDDALYPGQQIPYVLSGGIGGLVAVAIGAVLGLSADLRDEWRKLDEIDQKLERLLEAQAAAPSEVTIVEPVPTPARRRSRPARLSSDGAGSTARRSRAAR